MQIGKTLSVYTLLGVAWLTIAGWQGFEHERFERGTREALLDRAREIASTLSVVIRSQGRFGVLRQARLEAALKELAQSNELQSVMLLNSAGQVVASAGQPIDLRPEDLPKQDVRWGRELVTIVDLVDLGSNASNDSPTSNATIVLKENEQASLFRHRRSLPAPPSPKENDGRTSGAAALRPLSDDSSFTMTQAAERFRHELELQRSGRKPPSFVRPFWMKEDQYRKLIVKQGLHGFVLQMPTVRYKAEVRQDLWIRLTTLMIALLAVGGMGVAWRSAARMNKLQLRLLRTSEMNVRLQELNIAAAGLAHETRNPLNIVRGLAQMISQSPELSGAIRQKANAIAVEVDRVTGRLNEFINYSRSPEPRPAPTRLMAVIGDVQRALESDLAEKVIHCGTRGPDLTVEADESLLRQVVFNLLLNAIQAVGRNGRVEVVIQNGAHGKAFFEVRDDGPGVPPDLRPEIFKPYFTTRPEGTGMGLAVVRQLVLTHHWEIEYVPGPDGGAGFRVSGLKVS